MKTKILLFFLLVACNTNNENHTEKGRNIQLLNIHTKVEYKVLKTKPIIVENDMYRKAAILIKEKKTKEKIILAHLAVSICLKENYISADFYSEDNGIKRKNKKEESWLDTFDIEYLYMGKIDAIKYGSNWKKNINYKDFIELY